METRFFQAIWLGKDTSTNENILGISGQIVKARTIRRQTKPDKYNKQMMDIIDSTPMTTPTPTSFVVLPTKHSDSSKQATATAETQTQQAPGTSSSEGKPTHGYTGNHRRSNGNIANVIPPKSTTTKTLRLYLEDLRHLSNLAKTWLT